MEDAKIAKRSLGLVREKKIADKTLFLALSLLASLMLGSLIAWFLGDLYVLGGGCSLSCSQPCYNCRS